MNLLTVLLILCYKQLISKNRFIKEEDMLKGIRREKETVVVPPKENDDGKYDYERDVALIAAEIENMCSVTDWYDEHTGRHLFTDKCTFVPESGYYSTGQGHDEHTYTAHFKLPEGKTAEEVFFEMRDAWRDQMIFEFKAKERYKKIKTLPTDIQDDLIYKTFLIEAEAGKKMRLEIKAAQEAAILQAEERIIAKKEAFKQASEVRKKDPEWHRVCQSAKLLVKANLKDQAKVLVKGYLLSHDR